MCFFDESAEPQMWIKYAGYRKKKIPSDLIYSPAGPVMNKTMYDENIFYHNACRVASVGSLVFLPN